MAPVCSTFKIHGAVPGILHLHLHPLFPPSCNRYPLILTQPLIRNVYRVTGPFLTHLLAGWQNFSDESISIASSNVLPSLSSLCSTSLPQFRVQDSWTGPTTWKISLGISRQLPSSKIPRREIFEIPANFNISNSRGQNIGSFVRNRDNCQFFSEFFEILASFDS